MILLMIFRDGCALTEDQEHDQEQEINAVSRLESADGMVVYLAAAF
jgi:hypothetical protein